MLDPVLVHMSAPLPVSGIFCMAATVEAYDWVTNTPALHSQGALYCSCGCSPGVVQCIASCLRGPLRETHNPVEAVMGELPSSEALAVGGW